jgi:hypothetical protein
MHYNNTNRLCLGSNNMYPSKSHWLLVALLYSQAQGSAEFLIEDAPQLPQYPPQHTECARPSILRSDRPDATIFVSRPIADGHDALRTVINTGSLLGFRDPSGIGDFIRSRSDDGRRGFSHVGMAIVAYPSEMIRIINESAVHGGLFTRDFDYTRAQRSAITDAYPYLATLQDIEFGAGDTGELLDVFCLESTGAAGQVFKGLLPRVQITPLKQVLEDYVGDVCVRTLRVPLTLSSLEHLIIDQLGVSYEKNPFQLLKSTRDGNKEDDISSWFCSELVAYIYRDRGIIPQGVKANNVIPKEFSVRSEIDYLHEYAGREQWLKLYVKSSCCCW